MTSTIPAPRTGYDRHKSTRSRFELWAWLFMRLSGVVLIVLIFGHLFVNLWQGEGVQGLDFGFVAGKWASPFWQIWDLLMLWLAMLHGTNGMRTIISDYAEKPRTRMALLLTLYIASAVIIVLGTLVIFTFDPCPVGADPSLIPDFCSR
ncbi:MULTISPECIES: succinate dehydrogenase hydrophobic membrane anchor subunit [Brevibacterium]|uniref:Succinate dehydrogenase n=2 Tax=Brevibacterium TaxID=1696 RepID=A0A2N6PJE7_9MICO|nr:MULTISPECIES: succinate dehydrogenase hydrophobic membrane anchor subunit [Brevibacterium]MBD8019326.1 succinate dehydrogenase hydrophobic membrane anchor subunit [Brevibacterium gallinarum]MBM7528063.1 succinate dehydrogenase / fumarate reductase membrane anchor subunit [Brevibacterium luteolum]MBU8579225.1 succinate dehydrogenase hydrophobic membrane anchor subunit [Brevibacterium luteolum]MCT1657774.1 succinate dehydrogenase hydrophobic membrane anchor subunit [Brevibacterium luteolum]MC